MTCGTIAVIPHSAGQFPVMVILMAVGTIIMPQFCLYTDFMACPAIHPLMTACERIPGGIVVKFACRNLPKTGSRVAFCTILAKLTIMYILMARSALFVFQPRESPERPALACFLPVAHFAPDSNMSTGQAEFCIIMVEKRCRLKCRCIVAAGAVLAECTLMIILMARGAPLLESQISVFPAFKFG